MIKAKSDLHSSQTSIYMISSKLDTSNEFTKFEEGFLLNRVSVIAKFQYQPKHDSGSDIASQKQIH